ncbi:hypothetical protein GO755_27905 [Spirosoma sp. HMF4905]|uniref:Uncharacterized protein n=1 Tax=Spirosoma arboris TaxID=2682092 RepID=A0A7K1SJG2_9BACT|nr:hypothetical protein [Spirosoma arboris]MVM33893.1 hypothetical protein [Spirosoma arboris]
MKNENKRLSDVTRQNSTDRVNKFANSLMPMAPKPKVDQPKEEATASPVESTPEHEPIQPTQVALGSEPPKALVKAERVRKTVSFSVDDVVSIATKEGDVFNKMVRITDDHHELLRELSYKYRKNMNTIVRNLIDLLDQAYQKEKKGGEGHA